MAFNQSKRFFMSFEVDPDRDKEIISRVCTSRGIDAFKQKTRFVLEIPSYMVREFQVHPLYANIDTYINIFSSDGRILQFFHIAMLRERKTFVEIVMAFQIYVEPMVITPVESYLFAADTMALQRAASNVGIPIGEELAKLRKDKNIVITKIDVIRAVLKRSNVTNFLTDTVGSEFLESIAGPIVDELWYAKL